MARDEHRQVAEGAADRSYGIAVAKLAGLPPKVVTRAKSVLAKLEAGRDATGGIAAGLDDLPLFAAAAFAAEQLIYCKSAPCYGSGNDDKIYERKGTGSSTR